MQQCLGMLYKPGMHQWLTYALKITECFSVGECAAVPGDAV